MWKNKEVVEAKCAYTFVYMLGNVPVQCLIFNVWG